MKKRKSFKDTFEILILLLISIACFAGGYFLSWNFVKPLDENQFALCEQIAQNAYDQRGNVLIEAPDEYEVEMTTTTITVRAVKLTYRGCVIAKLQDGELVITRDEETSSAIAQSIFFGIIVMLVGILAVGVGSTIIESKVQSN